MFWYGGSLCKMVLEMGLNRLCVSWCPSYCIAWIISGTWSVVSFAILEPKSRNFAFYACQNFRSWYFVSATKACECSVSHFNSFHDENGTILSSLLYKPTNVDNLRRWSRVNRSSSSSVFVSWFVLTDLSHRCLQCLANLDHTGPNCPVRSFLHLVFGRPCWLVHSLGIHSFALMVQRLSDPGMWPAHLCFALLVALMISLAPVSWRIQVFRFRSRRRMPSIMRSILRCATARLNVHTTLKGF